MSSDCDLCFTLTAHHIEFADEIERALTDLEAVEIGLSIGRTAVRATGFRPSQNLCRSSRVSARQGRQSQGARDYMIRQHLTFDQRLTVGLFCPSSRVGDALHSYHFDTQPVLKIIIESGSGNTQELVKPLRIYSEP